VTDQLSHGLDLEALHGPLHQSRCRLCRLPYPCFAAREAALAAARRAVSPEKLLEQGREREARTRRMANRP
jgi:hypothetical protein